MDKIYDICCGIDVHKKLIVACLNHKQQERTPGTSVRPPGTDGTGRMAAEK
ncbi:MAG: hypothetical protein ACLUTZ_02425 [Oliverpabstia sp.]